MKIRIKTINEKIIKFESECGFWSSPTYLWVGGKELAAREKAAGRALGHIQKYVDACGEYPPHFAALNMVVYGMLMAATVLTSDQSDSYLHVEQKLEL